jgi:DNA-binding CsgD family transcriptional regulator
MRAALSTETAQSNISREQFILWLLDAKGEDQLCKETALPPDLLLCCLSRLSTNLIIPKSRVRQLAQGILDAKSNKAIAYDYGLSSHTVKMYMYRLFRLFEVSSRAELGNKLRALKP